MKKKKLKFLITVDEVPGVTIADWRNYIRTAVECWAGGGDPEDPLYACVNATVKRVKEEEKP